MSRLKELLARVRALFTILAVVAIVGGLIALLASLAGGDGDEGQDGPPLAIAAIESSWVPGQLSLVTAPAYLAVAQRAETLAADRERARIEDLERRERAKRLAAKRKQDEARRRFLEAKRRAAALYRAALRRAAALRRKRARELAAARRKAALERRRYLESLKVKPGDECRFEDVRQRFACLEGRLEPGG